MARKKLQLDALDTWMRAAEQDPRLAILAMLWKDRHRNPEMSVSVTEADLEGCQKSMEYMGAKPEVRIFRRLGREATAGIPATKGKRAVPPSPAIPPSAFVIVAVLERGTFNAIKPIENNEDGARGRDQADVVRRARDRVAMYSTAVRQAAASGTFSQSDITELCGAAEALARAA